MASESSKSSAWKTCRGSRDPYARTEVVRRVVARASDVHYWTRSLRCNNCGCSARPRYPLCQYRIEHDGGQVEDIKGVFCGKSCASSYYGADLY